MTETTADHRVKIDSRKQRNIIRNVHSSEVSNTQISVKAKSVSNNVTQANNSDSTINIGTVSNSHIGTSTKIEINARHDIKNTISSGTGNISETSIGTIESGDHLGLPSSKLPVSILNNRKPNPNALIKTYNRRLSDIFLPSPDALPVTDGNRIHYLIAAEDTQLEVYKKLINAKKTVYIAAWFYFQPDTELLRGGMISAYARNADLQSGKKITLGALLVKLAKKGVKVKILVDKNILASVTKMYNEKNQEWIRKAQTGEFVFKKGSIELVFVRNRKLVKGNFYTEHRKTIVIDSKIAFILGQNFTDNDYGTRRHAIHDKQRNKGGKGILGSNVTYKPKQDVSSVIEGPAVESVESSFVTRWNKEVAKNRWLVANKYAGKRYQDGVKMQILRTTGVNYSNQIREIGVAREKLLQKARKYIYIEDQYFRDDHFARQLAEKLKNNPSLKVIIVTNEDKSRLSPSAGHTQNAYEILKPYTIGNTPQVRFYKLVSTGKKDNFAFQSKDVYIHTKVMIVDDKYILQGSANMNQRSVKKDTEIVGLVANEKKARELRANLWRGHLGVIKSNVIDLEKGLRLWNTIPTSNKAKIDNNTQIQGHAVPWTPPKGQKWKNKLIKPWQV